MPSTAAPIHHTQAISYSAGDLCRDLMPTMVAIPGVVTEGTPGNDIIRGTEGDDVIRGSGGNDIICSLAGTDTIETGDGNDFVESGSGDDVISDTGGHNLIRAGSGDDTVTTGSGHDSIDGGFGDDGLSSGAGNDTLAGGLGADSIAGGPGHDDCGLAAGADSVASCGRSVGSSQQAPGSCVVTIACSKPEEGCIRCNVGHACGTARRPAAAIAGSSNAPRVVRPGMWWPRASWTARGALCRIRRGTDHQMEDGHEGCETCRRDTANPGTADTGAGS